MRIPSSAYLEFACWKAQRIQNIRIFFIKCALKLQRPGGNRREFRNIFKIDAAQLNYIIDGHEIVISSTVTVDR